MNDKIIVIDLNNIYETNRVKTFLKNFNLNYDQVDYTIVICNQNNEIIATASIFFNLIKCLAVDGNYQNFNLSNKLISFLIKVIYEKDYNEVFILTKIEYKNNFKSLNFKLIYYNNKIVFFTNRFDLLNKYLQYLKSCSNKITGAILIMNCNPFTLGHQYLISVASSENKIVYVIVVKEELSIFPYKVRIQLVKAGVKHLKNVKVIEGSQYLLSKVIFPSYFLKSKKEIIQEQAYLDANIFCNLIAKNLNANIRYLGEEPLSYATNIYNNVLQKVLNEKNINWRIIKRYQINDTIISASLVRELLLKNDFESIKKLVPPSTYEYLKKY